jgi:hypothetical protein
MTLCSTRTSANRSIRTCFSYREWGRGWTREFVRVKHKRLTAASLQALGQTPMPKNSSARLTATFSHQKRSKKSSSPSPTKSAPLTTRRTP